MKKFIFFILAIALFTRVVYAEVTQFVFITDPQTIPINTNSGTITVQSQNSSGTSENITETNDIILTSSSATGVFLSTSGNPVSLTMSKNTANKNFMYVDPTSGTFTITFKATGRTSLQSFTVSQQITVGGGVPTPPSPETPSSSPPPPPPTPPNVTDISSAHSSPAPLSDASLNQVFEISAGRDRLTSVGNNIMFKATVTKLQNVPESAITYKWSFGDGATGEGNSVHHTYRFPGTYPVVLNATFSDKQAVSRLSVKVINPELSISKVSGGIEIWNKSNTEINLEGWKLLSGIKSFIFPDDSLIPAGSKIDFADETTSMNNASISLQNPLGKIFGTINPEVTKEVTEVSTTSQISLAELQDKIKFLKSKLSQISPNPVVVTTISQNVNINVATSAPAKTDEKKEETAAVIFTAPNTQSFIGKIFSWPTKGYSFVKHLFVEN